MNKYFKYIWNELNSIGNIYKDSSNWGKVLILFMLFILVIVIFKGLKHNKREGFEQSDHFLIKTNENIYDDFYADIYDYLVFNNIKTNYEVGEIINKTTPDSESIILDVGCGTGHHVAQLSENNLNVIYCIGENNTIRENGGSGHAIASMLD
jgi:hypothetical protein